MEAFQFIINQLQQIYKLQARILSVEYSLSPEHVWPKASEECIQAYRYLIHDLSVSPCRVIIAGDSAGGNLAATLLLRLKKERQERKEELMNDMFKRAPLPLPGGAALFSPWIDLSGFSLVDNKKDIIGNHQLEMFASCYLPSSSVNNKDPLISPIYGNFDDIDCPLFIAYGSEELLRPSIEEWISNKLKRDNVTVIQGQEATHIWLMSRLAAKTTKSFERDNRQFIQWLSTIYSC
ncbi:Alpha/beta hydrolase fold-3 [Cokeromyces recurvatus]|uniref:Alpha/beta hydrolase fold-3 n=1 Tax=Cokeromyces recurvatus TaxID=90255 RepID=UPI00221E5141|nr:Alpha/beta hydrolase fold-3 [Cokeromyces recurvatus]XP_051380151.1 Alpha/beta hydrolase fold-3 [Cokeromyces recurvatus]KAI7899118.1 Alpha/beta hydrolase fold-3 [Cokeromyces recurvatus]KAI7900166.1 Alpha/beta hydrolase fold-3 [Cokeromyces recurvatus]